MADKDSGLQEKMAYFRQQDLLDLSDDEKDFHYPGSSAAERLLAGSPPMPPPPPIRRGSSFLGPTPRERQQEFEAHATKHRAGGREHDPSLMRPSTPPETITQSFPVATFKQRHGAPQGSLKNTASMSDLAEPDPTPFYKRMGEIPRELRNANAKVANNIVVEPEHKQLLKEKIVYFFPNNDISMARRLQIHKIIQLGGAWVRTWRGDITHVVFDDDNHTYPQLLRYLNKTGLPVSSSYSYVVSAKENEAQSRRREVRSIYTTVHTVISTARSLKNQISSQRGTASKRGVNARTSRFTTFTSDQTFKARVGGKLIPENRFRGHQRYFCGAS